MSPSFAAAAGRCSTRSRDCRRIERQALELAYYGDLSQSQTARHLGQPLGTIKARTFKGLRRLSELLGPDRDDLVTGSDPGAVES
jgi:DNA-directed RNA polymerase specialized sigma24 family protein